MQAAKNIKETLNISVFGIFLIKVIKMREETLGPNVTPAAQ